MTLELLESDTRPLPLSDLVDTAILPHANALHCAAEKAQDKQREREIETERASMKEN